MALFVGILPRIIATFGIALAVILTAVASSRGANMIGKAAAALISEHPERFGQSLVLQMMSASQGLYGFIIGFLIFLNMGEGLTLQASMNYFFAGLIMGVAGYLTCIQQSAAATAGVQILAKKPEHSTKGLLYSAMIETYAIFTFVIAIMLVL